MKRLKFKNFIFINDYKNKWDEQINRLNKLFDNDLKHSKLYDLIISNLEMEEYFKDVILKESEKIDRKYANLEIKDLLSNFINYLILNYDNIFKNNNFLKNKVFLSTIHGSKGLQFDASFVCDLNNGSIPFYKYCERNCYEKNGAINDESLRLLNVAVSRSKKHLYLSSTHNNRTHETCILKPFYKNLQIIKE